MRVAAILLGFWVAFIGCSNRVQLTVDDLLQDQIVQIKTKSGGQVSGTVAKADSHSLVIRDKAGRSSRIQTSEIAEASGPKPILDPAGKLVSEQEIAQKRKNKNVWLYSAGGSLLSMGASFFASSMISRASDKKNDDPIIVAGTATGTAIGAYFFARAGRKKDCQHAITEILSARGSAASSEAASEKQRRENIQKEIDQLRRDREKQNAEIEELKKKIEKNKKQ